MILHRNCEIYQYQRKLNPYFDHSPGAQRYKYEKIWSQKYIDSSDYPEPFKNPPELKPQYQSKTFYGTVKLGDFELTQPQLVSLMESVRFIPLPKS